MTSDSTQTLLSQKEYSERHKKAFRVAFDFLNGHFPPSSDPDWWDNTILDASKAITGNDDFNLTRDLIFTIFDYIDRECKLRMDLKR